MALLGGGESTHGAVYTNTVVGAAMKQRQIQHGELTRGVVFRQDNAPGQTSTVTMAAIQKCGFQLVENPPNSPDLTPSS